MKSKKTPEREVEPRTPDARPEGGRSRNEGGERGVDTSMRHKDETTERVDRDRDRSPSGADMNERDDY